MEVTLENYRDPEIERDYWGYSKLKHAMSCPARCKAMYYDMSWKPDTTTSMNVGNVAEAKLQMSDEQFEKFLVDNSAELISTRGPTKGQLKATYQHALKMAEFVQRQPKAHEVLNGKFQQLVVGEIFGLPFKGLVDVIEWETDFPWITDIKTTRSLDSRQWSKPHGRSLIWYEYYQYYIQSYIYRELACQTFFADGFEMLLLAVTSEPVPDVRVYSWELETLDRGCLELEIEGLPAIEEVMKENPARCGFCDYCKETQIITKVHYI